MRDEPGEQQGAVSGEDESRLAGNGFPRSELSRTDTQSVFLFAMINFDLPAVGIGLEKFASASAHIGCEQVSRIAIPFLAPGLSARPSPFFRRVGIHIVTFEACSSFTHVTACTVAHPPYVGFIARLRPCQFPGSDARKLSSPTNNYLSGSFPHW